MLMLTPERRAEIARIVSLSRQAKIKTGPLGTAFMDLYDSYATLESALAASEQRAQEAEARVERLDKALDDARTAFNGLLNMGTRMQGELSVQDIKQIGRSLVNECSDHISDIRRAREARKEGTS